VIVTYSTNIGLSNAFSVTCVKWSAGVQHATSHAILVQAVDAGLNSQQLRQSLCTCKEKYLYSTCTLDTEAGFPVFRNYELELSQSTHFLYRRNPKPLRPNVLEQ